MKKTNGEGGFNPMGMMQKMMAQMQEGGVNPMQMCRMMSESVARASEQATWATPELRALFDDWAAQVKDELLAGLSEIGEETDLATLAERLHLDVGSVAFLVSGLAREGKVRLRVSAAAAKGA
jgi:hypothetical protein